MGGRWARCRREELVGGRECGDEEMKGGRKGVRVGVVLFSYIFVSDTLFGQGPLRGAFVIRLKRFVD